MFCHCQPGMGCEREYSQGFAVGVGGNNAALTDPYDIHCFTNEWHPFYHPDTTTIT